MFRFLTLIALFLISYGSFSQEEVSPKERKIIQFSGVIVNSENLEQIPFGSVMINKSNRGTISDYFGYFSFVAQELDTIVFSYIGYKPAFYVIPDTLSSDHYSLIQMMELDTVMLREITVFPWPSKEQFKEAFLNLEVPSDDYYNALRNLSPVDMQRREQYMALSGKANHYNAMKRQQSQLYSSGQFPSYNLLNPVAWAKFIESWRNGDFKK